MNEVLRKSLKEKKFKLEIDNVVDAITVVGDEDDLLGDEDDLVHQLQGNASYCDLLSPTSFNNARKSIAMVYTTYSTTPHIMKLLTMDKLSNPLTLTCLSYVYITPILPPL